MNAHSSIIADDLASEIAEVEIADAMDGEELTGLNGWFMRRTLAAKVRIASVFSLGGLAAITTFAISQQLGVGAERTSRAIVATSVLSIVTIPVASWLALTWVAGW